MVVFGYAPAYGVVVECAGLGGCVFGARTSCSVDLGEVVLVIPAKALVGVFATEFADKTAMAVVVVALVFKHPHQVVFDVAGLKVLGLVCQSLLAGVVEDGPVAYYGGGWAQQCLFGGDEWLVAVGEDGGQRVSHSSEPHCHCVFAHVQA